MKPLLFVTLLGIVVGLSSCEKDEPGTTCTHRKVTNVTIHFVPNANSLDPFSDPDYRVDFATSNSSEWSFATHTAENVTSLPVTIAFPLDIIMTDENWEVQLVDEDSPDADDLVCRESFNPFKIGENGVFSFEKDGQVLFELEYIESIETE